MARTIKRYPFFYWRQPKGKKRALAFEARYGAVPPDDYDDLPFDKQCWKPQVIAGRLLRKGRSKAYIERRLVIRYRLNRPLARLAIERASALVRR